MARKTALIVAGVMILLGVVSMVFLNSTAPKAECAEPSAPYSGYVEGDCHVTQASWDKIAEHNSKPKINRIAGLVLIVGGLGSGIYGLTRKSAVAAPMAGPAGAAGPGPAPEDTPTH